MIHFNCPHCSKQIRLAEEFAGRRGRCPHCRAPIQAPAAQAAPSPPAELFEDVEAPQPAVIRRGARSGKGKNKGPVNPMPFVIGGAAVGGVDTVLQEGGEVAVQAHWNRSFIDEQGLHKLQEGRCELIFRRRASGSLALLAIHGESPF